MQQTEIFPPRFFFFHLVHKEKLLRLLEGGKQEIIIKTLISLKVFKMLVFLLVYVEFLMRKKGFSGQIPQP